MHRKSKKVYRGIIALTLSLSLLLSSLVPVQAFADSGYTPDPVSQDSFDATYHSDSMIQQNTDSQSANNSNNSYLVKFKDKKSKTNFEKDKNKTEKIKKKLDAEDILVLEITNAEAMSMSEQNDVLYVEPDAPIDILSVGKPDKNDNKVKNMNKSTQEIPWGIKAVGSDLAPNRFDGKKIRVAVFDTGVSAHEDLQIKGGISFVDYTASYSDDNGHGTHVTGTIAAQNNKLGVLGASPEAEIYAVKVLDKNGSGKYSSVITALDWAINNDIDVINLSLGGEAYSMALHEAVQRATDAGIILVAAAGNKGNGSDTLTYPAKYSEVVAVGAVDESLAIAGFSSCGYNLNIVAPGVSVLSTANDGGYAVLSGTSMAAPHVTGALAALKSKNKKYTTGELINTIYDTATNLGNSNVYGNGLLNFGFAAGLTGPVTIEEEEPTPEPEKPEEPIIPQNPEFSGNPETPYTSPPVDNENQAKYYQLLEGNYKGGELVDKFHEIFGYYDPDYILGHYTEIFGGIDENQVDQGLLQILTYKGDIATFDPLLEALSETINEEGETIYARPHQEFEEELLAEREDEPGLNASPMETGFLTGTSSDETVIESAYNVGTTGDINASALDVDISFVSATNTSITLSLYYNPIHYNTNNRLFMYDYSILSPPYNGAWVNILGQYYYNNPLAPSGSYNYTVTGLKPGAFYSFEATVWNATSQVWVKKQIVNVRTTGAKAPSLTLNGNPTANGFSVNVQYPSEGVFGNYLKYWDGIQWIDMGGKDANYTSGTYSLNKFAPGKRYDVYMRYYERYSDGSSTYIDKRLDNIMLPLPSEVLQSYSRNEMTFTLDKCLVDSFDNTARFNRFLDKTNAGYNIMYDLVGGDKPYSGQKMQMNTSRTLNVQYEGQSGQPILWSINASPSYLNALDKVRAMVDNNTDVAESPFHEISHNFDSYKWTFEAEALAIFKIFYYFSITNEKLGDKSNDPIFTGGSGYKTYIKSHANRILGHVNYDASFAQGVYSPYGMAYVMANIQEKIGWEPFKQTFRYFNALPSASVPTTSIGKFNLFMTKLRDFSGKDVLFYITANEKTVIQNKLGGTIMYTSEPSIKLKGIKSDSITVLVTFPVSGASGNQLSITNVGPFNGTGTATANGIYSKTGLNPLINYAVVMKWLENGVSRSMTLNVLTPSLAQEVFMRDATPEEIQNYLNSGGQFHEEGVGASSADMDAQWGRKAHTKIAEQAFIILKNDLGQQNSSKLEETVYAVATPYNAKNVVIEWAWRTDTFGGEIGVAPFEGHFYGPGGKNYRGGTNRTAYHNFENHYKKALRLYESNDKYDAYIELGMAVHYLCDLNAPHHAANLHAFNSEHSAYEKWVENQVDNMLITTAIQNGSYESYDYVKNRTFLTMANEWSAAARGHINACNKTVNGSFSSSEAWLPTNELIARSQRATAALLFRFMTDTGRYID